MSPRVTGNPPCQLGEFADHHAKPPSDRLGIASALHGVLCAGQVAPHERNEVASAHRVVKVAKLDNAVLQLADEAFADASTSPPVQRYRCIRYQPFVRDAEGILCRAV
ncbi:hypothetical protein GCM10023192_24210 [Amycolatopsis samaneae]